jgi:hypothetical protein
LELIKQKKAILAAVYGHGVRQYRDQIRKLPSVELAFPKGLKLMVWLHERTSLDAFKQDLKRVSQALRIEPAIPTLHDATLRDLALAQRHNID